MRLKTQYKQKLTKTNKQKKANIERKKKGPKLNKNYMDDSDYNGDNIDLDLTQMRYGIVRCCDVDSIQLSEGIISIKNSWIELLLIMLDTVISNNSTNLDTTLEENNVTNMFFCVDKLYGKYNFEQKQYQYKAYKIFNTDYYLEIVETSEVIFNAIVGLTKCLDIPLNGIRFHLKNKIYKDTKLSFDILEETETIVTINELEDNYKDEVFIVSMKIFNDTIQVHRLDVALIAFCNKIYDEYGIIKLASLPRYESTGVILNNTDDTNNNIVKIRDSEVSVYTDNDKSGIIKFIHDSMIMLDIDNNEIKFKLKSLKSKDKLKEWEVD